MTPKKSENPIAGAVGAFLGSLLGVACIILVGQLGYVASISGVVIAVCTLKGYEILGGVLSRKGIVISCLLMVLMTYVGYQADLALQLARIVEVDFFSAFQGIGTLLDEGYLPSGTYWGGLIMLYMFTLLGAVPTILSTLRKRQEVGVPTEPAQPVGTAQEPTVTRYYPAHPTWMRPLRMSLVFPLFLLLILLVALLLVFVEQDQNGLSLPLIGALAGATLSTFSLLFVALYLARPCDAFRWIFVHSNGQLWRVDLNALNALDTYRFSKKNGAIRALQWERLTPEEQQRAQKSIQRAIEVLSSQDILPGSVLALAVRCLPDPRVEKENKWTWTISYQVGRRTTPEAVANRKTMVIAKAYPDLSPAPGTQPSTGPVPPRWSIAILILGVTALLTLGGFAIGAVLSGGHSGAQFSPTPYVGDGFTLQVDQSWTPDEDGIFWKDSKEYYQILSSPLGSATPEDVYDQLSAIWAEDSQFVDGLYPTLTQLRDGMTEDGDDYQFFLREWTTQDGVFGCSVAVIAPEKNLLLSFHGYTSVEKDYTSVAQTTVGLMQSLTFQIGQKDELSGGTFLCKDGSQISLNPDGSFLWYQLANDPSSPCYTGTYEVFYGQEAVDTLSSLSDYGLTEEELEQVISSAQNGYYPGGSSPMDYLYALDPELTDDRPTYYVCKDTFYGVILHNETLVQGDGSSTPTGYDTVYAGFYIPELQMADLTNLNTTNNAQWTLQEGSLSSAGQAAL